MINRRTFVVGTGAVLAVSAAGAGAGAAVSYGSPSGSGARRSAAAGLWEEYRAAPYTHPQIPHVARAGYLGGEVPPRQPVKVNVRDHGAVGDGSADDAPAINKAIEEAGKAGGGAVLVPAGTYRTDDVIRVGYDDVVLRGEGSGTTVLKPTRHLEDVIGVHESKFGGDKSAWSWTGGLVWVSHRERYRELVDTIRKQRWALEQWTGDETLATVTEAADRGAFRLKLDSAGKLQAGQRVLLKLEDDGEYGLLRHMAGDVEGAGSYPWKDKDRLLSFLPYTWPVRITKVDGETVELDRPLPLDARTAFKPRLTSTGPVVTGSGVEGLTIALPKQQQGEHLQDKGFNGLLFQCAWDCWADDVVVRDSDNGVILTCTTGVTLRRTTVAGRMRHHSYACREQSHDNLFEDFAIDKATSQLPSDAIHHGINVEGVSSGNVWSKGRMDNGTFDSHRGMPFANVRTEITVDNDGEHGGAEQQGPLWGARFAHWNIEVTNERAGCIRLDKVAPRSATVAISQVRDFGQIPEADFSGDLDSRLESYGDTGITPSNLHAAQRELDTP